jgi:hypothetical protein
MGTPRKRTVAVAAGVSAALLASSTAFAVANGILGSRPNDKVGTFGMIEQRLVPAESPARTTAPRSAPQRVTTTTTAIGAQLIVPAAAQPPESPDTNAPGAAPYAPAPEQEPDEHSTPKPTIVAPVSTTPTTHTTASTVPKEDDHEHETDDTEKDDD